MTDTRAVAGGTAAVGALGDAAVEPAEVITGVLRESPFLRGFTSDYLAVLADHARLTAVDPGGRIISEGEPAAALYLLVSGSVELTFGVQGGPETSARQALQSVTHQGQPIGWSALIEPYAYRATATAVTATTLVVLERAFLEQYAQTHPAFGVELMRAVIGLLGDRLRAMRLRLVARRYDDDVTAIRNLLEDSAAELSVASPLHKLPHFLENRLTLDDAFHLLDVLRVQGDGIERELADLCGEGLARVRQELELYQQLQRIYDVVAGAPAHMPPEQVRHDSLGAFQKFFGGTSHVVAGLELLPSQAGAIFIMNHLQNHPENLLPNHFILTLDTHFVASTVLLPRYGDAPIRVIRKSRPEEYGHQGFYDRLGYIYTYSGFVDADSGDPASSRESRRRHFLDAAASYLGLGKNVVICPEGTSTTTENSPVRFRGGAFELAAYVQPEPLIVPIVVANFDKKLSRTTTATVVHEPFRLSDHVPDAGDTEALHRFINDGVTAWYRTWVREAVELAAQADAAGAG